MDDGKKAAARELLEALARLLDQPVERPVFVVAVGHDLTDADAANIQRAVMLALNPPDTRAAT